MIQTVDHQSDPFTIEAAIAKFGAGKVLRSAILALLTRSPKPVNVDVLSNHLRKDIGLGPNEPPPDPRRFIR
ncbi:hypothetical protein [uncultured Thioclava sp.]|uniref:DUF1127 domain-containing protein n=1 Tax=Thioclava arctica TaxID=3238301 RepID=A0ABV3TLH1_9RHOB|nr:hypothetical protein [uncultured Thioclava sp.]